MANSEEMQAAIMQVAIKAATAMVRVMRKADPPAKPHSIRNTPEECCRPMMSQPAFNWKMPDRYVEVLNFEMEVENVVQAEMYDLSEEGKVPIIKNWLGRERLQFILALTKAEKEACKYATGLLNDLKEKIR